MSSVLEVHATLVPTAADTPLRPGDEALLTAHVTTSGAPVEWPTPEELETALAGKVVVSGEGADVAGNPGAAAGSGVTVARAWHVQILAPPGEAEIGPFTVSVAGESVEVPAVPVTVTTVLEEPVAQELDAASADAAVLKETITRELASPRGPWELRGEIPWALILAALLALALLAGYIVWRILRKRRAEPARVLPLEPAEVVARRRLAALRDGGLLARGQHLAFHVEIADILREYASRRTGLDLRDRTTDETRELLGGELRARASREGGSVAALVDMRADVLGVLAACDLVKFAKAVPAPAEAIALAGDVNRIVTRSTDVAPPAPAATASGDSQGPGARATTSRTPRATGAAG